MSQTILVDSLIFKDLTYVAPATIEEYNALAPKRTNPVLEDAVDNIIKHKVLSQFRNKFLDALEVKFKDVDGSARQNSGTEKRPVWEKDMAYMTRLAAVVIASRGQNPADAAVQSAFADELRSLAQETLTAVKFNVAEREPSTSSGGAVAKTYTAMATDAIKVKGSAFADKLLAYLNKTLGSAHAFVGVEDDDIATLAKAISANEKRKRDIELAAAKSEYELAGSTEV